MRIGILGAGAWGTTLAISAGRKKNKVILWSNDGADKIEQSRVSPYLKNEAIPKSVRVTGDLSDLWDSDIWLVTTPSEYFGSVIKNAKPYWKKQPVLICSKGMDAKSGKFMSEILIEEYGNNKNLFGFFSGPGFAKDVVSGTATGITVSGSEKIFDLIEKSFPENFYFEHSEDVIGADICGAGKNAIALIMGFVGKRQVLENERALIITKLWQEIISFGLKSGAKLETFSMLCGLGDLFMTASSSSSRNYSAGNAIAHGVKVIGTVEGVSALQWLLKRADEKNIDMPLMKDFAADIL